MNAGWTAFGQELTQLRTKAGVSIEDLCRATKIRKPLLAALEAGRFDELPPPVFVAGHIQAIAARLGVDGTALVARYRTLVEGQEPVREGSEVEPTRQPEETPRSGRSVAVWFLFFVVVLAGAAAWYWLGRGRAAEVVVPEPPRTAPSHEPGYEPAQSVEPGRESETPAAPAGNGAEVPGETSQPPRATPPAGSAVAETQAAKAHAEAPVPAGAEPPASGSTPPPVPAEAPAPATEAPPTVARESMAPAGDLVLVVTKPCWIELYRGDERLVHREVKAGETLAFSGADFRVTLGDASAVVVRWHGRDLTLPRTPGKVLRDLPVPGPLPPADGSP